MVNKEWAVTQEPIRHVDATPDIEYPIRILKAHLENCNCKFASSTGEIEEKDQMLKFMNECNDKRAVILNRAISILEQELRG